MQGYFLSFIFSSDFPLLQKFSPSIFRPVILLIPCPILSHGSLNEEKFQIPNLIHSFVAVQMYFPIERYLCGPFAI